MSRSALKLTHACPKASHVLFEGRKYPLLFEAGSWRLRSRSKKRAVDYRTGLTGLLAAQKAAREWLAREAENPKRIGRGGGTLEALAALYLATPKRTKENVARDNVSRLRTICRVVLEKELAAVTCREAGPELWQRYQRATIEAVGHSFDLATRRRENIAINAAVRAARCLFLPALLRVYRAAGLDTQRDAGECAMLPEPYLPPSTVDDADLVRQWAPLREADASLWLVIGLARFAGLRREEIAHLRAGWLEQKDGVVSVSLRDRPEEQWWTKTGKPYRAQVINADLSAHLLAFIASGPADRLLIGEPPGGGDRGKWFERTPQRWLHAHGVTALKPLHRLRGLYADNLAKLTQDAVTARLAGVKAAQEGLGHTTSATTEAHYLSPE